MVANQSHPHTTPPPPEAAPPERKEGRNRALADVGPLLGLINGVIAAFVGAYATTGSVLITVIAGGAALALAVLVVVRK